MCGHKSNPHFKKYTYGPVAIETMLEAKSKFVMLLSGKISSKKQRQT